VRIRRPASTSAVADASVALIAFSIARRSPADRNFSASIVSFVSPRFVRSSSRWAVVSGQAATNAV